MNISPVSFGKVIKVNAPEAVVDELADIANSKEKTRLARDLKALFNDRKNGKVQRYSNGIDTFLLSGIDSKYLDREYARYTNYNLANQYFQRMNYYTIHNVEGAMEVKYDGTTPVGVNIFA